MTYYFRFILMLSATMCCAQTPRADVSGDWQVSWKGRLGTGKGLLSLSEDGSKLTGTFKDVHGLSTVSGTAGEKQVSFDVHFDGPQPYTIRFTGSLDNGTMSGISQAIGIGDSKPYLGHGGEIVQPERPWTAVRELTSTSLNNR